VRKFCLDFEKDLRFLLQKKNSHGLKNGRFFIKKIDESIGTVVAYVFQCSIMKKWHVNKLFLCQAQKKHKWLFLLHIFSNYFHLCKHIRYLRTF